MSLRLWPVVIHSKGSMSGSCRIGNSSGKQSIWAPWNDSFLNTPGLTGCYEDPRTQPPAGVSADCNEQSFIKINRWIKFCLQITYKIPVGINYIDPKRKNFLSTQYLRCLKFLVDFEFFLFSSTKRLSSNEICLYLSLILFL